MQMGSDLQLDSENFPIDWNVVAVGKRVRFPCLTSITSDSFLFISNNS